MRIDVIGRQIDITDAIRTYAEGKVTRLTKYFDGVQLIRVTISKPNHAHHGDFDVELILDVEKHDDFVSHASNKDLYAAIDLVTEKGERQLRDFKEQIKGGKH